MLNNYFHPSNTNDKYILPPAIVANTTFYILVSCFEFNKNDIIYGNFQL